MKLSFSPSFKRMNLSQQINFTKNVVKQMGENPKFLPLENRVRDLDQKLSEWENAINEAQFGGKMRAIKKIEKGLTVLDQLDFLAQQVSSISSGKKEIIEAAGFSCCCEAVVVPSISSRLSSQSLVGLH